MAKNTSKNKGNSFERDICKKLSLWVSNNTRDDVFWRTQNSGGRFTIRHKKNKDTYQQDGDITCIIPDYNFFTNKFYIECKHYKSVDLWSIIDNSINGNIIKWWNRAIEDSSINNKTVLLIIKENRRPTLFITDNNNAKIIEELLLIKPKIIVNELNISIFKFDDILKTEFQNYSKYLYTEAK